MYRKVDFDGLLQCKSCSNIVIEDFGTVLLWQQLAYFRPTCGYHRDIIATTIKIKKRSQWNLYFGTLLDIDDVEISVMLRTMRLRHKERHHRTLLCFGSKIKINNKNCNTIVTRSVMMISDDDDDDESHYQILVFQ